MEVYLLPVGRDRYELYCEAGASTSHEPSSHGRFARIIDRFRTVLATVEEEERRQHQDAPSHAAVRPGPVERAKRKVLRWMAERLAEQRLLWRLRNVNGVVAAHPDDLASPAALDQIRKMLARDVRRHIMWLVVVGIAFVASGIVAPIPGPNILAYYFAFRLVGHFLSMRGAQHGLSGVEWSLRPNEALTSLRLAAAMDTPARADHVKDIATRLGLRGLPRFYERTALAAA